MTDTKALQAELDAMNAEWKAITAKRKAWMDEHMADFAQWPIGTELFHLDTGKRAGVITGYYRFHATQDDPRYDYRMSIDYRLTGGDNTSRYPSGVRGFGSREDLIARRESEIARLAAPQSSSWLP